MRSTRLRFLPPAAALLSVLLGEATAAANGRFPESNHLFFSKTDPNLVLLRVTFGLLVSHDRGKSFDHVCEASIGTSGVEDPMYAITPSNRLVATTFEGVVTSADQACTFAAVGGDLASKVFVDLTTNPNDTANILVFASTYSHLDDAGARQFVSNIWESKDEGRTFAPLPGTIDPTLLGYTIDLTASDPQRIYVTGVATDTDPPKGFLLTSRDHGTSWDELEIPLEKSERSLYIAAVDPRNAERVYLRTATTVDTPDRPTRLLLREGAPGGGAASVRTLFEAKGALPGFALSADSAKVYIGGPLDGIQVADTTGFAFETRSSIGVQCLASEPDGLWACSNERAGFIAGVSNDDGKTFAPLLRFCGIRGALACPAGTPTGDRCAATFPSLQASLGCEVAGSTADAGGAALLAPPPSATGSRCGYGAPGSRPWDALPVAGIVAAGGILAWARRRTRRPR